MAVGTLQMVAIPGLALSLSHEAFNTRISSMPTGCGGGGKLYLWGSFSFGFDVLDRGDGSLIDLLLSYLPK